MSTKIGIIGCAGRMGKMLVAEVLETEGCILAGGVEHPGSDAVGLPMGLGLAVGDSAQALFDAADAVIDFSSPAALASNAALAAASGKALIVGTTGLGPEHLASLTAAARNSVIVQSPNMSLGVNILLALVEQVARTLDDTYDIEIIEMHHRHKVDAPSGTALGLGRAAALGRGVDLDAVSQTVRNGPRKTGDIGFATLRGGDVVGDHTVVFATEGERIEITHKASSRLIFATGAVRAAMWAKGKIPGLYTMKDVLGLVN